MMKTVGKVQGGELLLRSTSLGEYGLLVGDDKVLTSSIYWNSKAEMVEALEGIIKILADDS